MSARPEWEFAWVTTDGELQQFVARALTEPQISIDTETAGWQTGNEKLCLIQIGLPAQKFVGILDPLAIPNLALLAPLVEGDLPIKIAHNASFEEKQLGRHKLKLRGIVDTLVMARSLRPDLPNHTLQTCCRHLLQLDVSKEEQTSDWSVRPLSRSQLDYARLDAEIAYKVYAELAALEARLIVAPEWDVPDLMRELASSVRDRLVLTKSIATELAYQNARVEMLEQAIKAKLSGGSPAYEGEFGSASVSRIKQTTVSPQKVKTEFPDIAPLAIGESVERKKLVALLEEHGYDKRDLERVLDITGYTDRVHISVKDA